MADAHWNRARIEAAIFGVAAREAPAITDMPVRVNDTVAEPVFGRTHVHDVIERPAIVARDGAFVLLEGVRPPPTCARHEIPNAVPGAHARIKVLMGLEDDIHAVFTKDRLEFGSEQLVLVPACESEPPASLRRVDGEATPWYTSRNCARLRRIPRTRSHSFARYSDPVALGRQRVVDILGEVATEHGA